MEANIYGDDRTPDVPQRTKATARKFRSIWLVPAAFFEIILMPIWLYAKGFNGSAIASKPAKTETNEMLSVA